MARRSSTSTFSRIVYGAVVLVFSLIALAVTYQAFTQGVSLRSKAAQTDVIYKGWEFNGKTVDGWVGEPHTTSVANGSLRMVIRKTKSVPDILQKNANASLPQGNKYLKFLISVGGDGKRSALPSNQVLTATSEIINDPEFTTSVQSNLVCTQDVKQCPDGSYVGRTGPSCVLAPCSIFPTSVIPSVFPTSVFPSYPPKPPQRTIRAAVYYKLTSSKRWEKPLEFDVVADGSFREYAVRFPEIAAMTVERVRITFPSGLREGETVLFDWIRLMGMKQLPPPPPSITPSSSPTPGCFYQQVECFTAPCDPILVCPTPVTTTYPPSTPKPTYYPSPIASSCQDSDYGKNYYVKGTTVGMAADGVMTTRQDSCWPKNYYGDGYDYVAEWFCWTNPDGKQYAINTNEKCTGGCYDGACSIPPQ